MEKTARIKELVTIITNARNDYYNNQPKISDKVFDAYVDELSELDPKNIAIISIGAEPISEWEKYTHKVPMGSLNKAQTTEEFEKWYKDHFSKDDEIFLTTKLDGLSLSLIYENGTLVRAATRGSGITGELITKNVAKMHGVPLKLNKKIDATIRGEIVLSKNKLKKYFQEYSNARNTASGVARRYDGSGCEHLDVLCYSLITDDIEIKNYMQMFVELNNLGFITPPYYVLDSVKDVDDVKLKYQQEARDKFQYEIDGLVASLSDLKKHDACGIVSGRPKGSIAYKFDAISREGNVSDIVIQVGNSGRLTPVAVFNPKINLMGAEVERASLHNFSNIQELGIDIGAKVLVCRSNDVIPFVEAVVESTNTIFKAPKTCPECNSAVVQNGEYLQCPNTTSCPAQKTGRIKNYIKELNILEWGDSLITRLVESGKVNDVSDLYKLTVDDLASVERMGKRSAKKCYDLLWASKEIALEVLIGALSIPLIGQSTIKLVMSAGYDTLEKMYMAKTTDLEKINGLGPARASSLADGLSKNKVLISKLLERGVIMKTKTEGKLNGKSFALTGAMVNKRAVLEKMIQDAGGEVKGSVNKNLTYLVIADAENSTSSKAVNARSLGVTLISEEQLLQMME